MNNPTSANINLTDLARRFEDCWRSCDTETALREVVLPALAPRSAPTDGEIVITTTMDGRCVAVSRQDEDGRTTKILWEAAPIAGSDGEQKPVFWTTRGNLSNLLQNVKGTWNAQLANYEHRQFNVPLYAAPIQSADDGEKINQLASDYLTVMDFGSEFDHAVLKALRNYAAAMK